MVAELDSVDSVDIPSEKLEREGGGLVACRERTESVMSERREGSEKQEGSERAQLTDVARDDVRLDGQDTVGLDRTGSDIEG